MKTLPTAVLVLLLALPQVSFSSYDPAKAEHDSIVGLIKAQATDTGKINTTARLYNEVMWKWRDKQAFQQLINALELGKRINYKEGVATIYKHMAGFSLNVGNRDFAIKYIRENMRLNRELGDSVGLAGAYHNFARTFSNPDSSKLYFLKAIKIFERPQFYNPARLGTAYTQIGMLYHNMGNDSTGFFYLLKAYELRKTVGEKEAILNSLMFLAMVYEARKEYDKAIETQQAKIPYLRFQKDYGSIATTYTGISSDYLEKGNTALARAYLDSALQLRPKLSYDLTSLNICRSAYKLYERTGNLEKAFFYAKEYRNLMDTIYSSEKVDSRNEMIVRYETQETANTIELLQQKNELQDELITRKRTILYAVGLAALLLTGVAIVLFRANNNRKRAGKLLSARNQEIESQKAIIEARNKDIFDSIYYAQRIQQTILPAPEELSRLLPESFVLFRPKDVVSGDFYWVNEQNGKVIVAAADCTGHGVPGALMSMIGSTLLNEIVNAKGITVPADILFQLREGIIQSLKQTGAAGENKDGMDIALCAIDRKKNTVEFAGANNPLWIIQGDGQLTEVKGDKQPIGIYSGEPKPFSNRELKTGHGDLIYIFTDGYADQFGGPGGKKFKYRQLQEVLMEVSKKPMPEQAAALQSRFEEWKGKLEQVDDVLVMGIKL